MIATLRSVDSRLYVHAFAVRSLRDFPSAFEPFKGREHFRLGVFLLGSENGEASALVPRILLVAPGRVVIQWHPVARQQNLSIPLVDLDYVESARFLLSALLSFAGRERELTLRYHARNSGPVDEWLGCLRREWLRDKALPVRPAASFGVAPNLKFGNVQASELDLDEVVLFRFFAYDVGAEVSTRPVVLSSGAADLVASTERRILWITDRYAGRHEPYGFATRYGPIQAVATIAVISRGSELVVTFRCGNAWRIPLRPDTTEQARMFVRELRQLYAWNFR